MKKMFDGFNGSLLVKQRVLKGLSRKELADILGVSDVSVLNWEKGKTRPKIVYVRKMNDLFGVKDDYWTQFMMGFSRMEKYTDEERPKTYLMGGSSDSSRIEMSKKIYALEKKVSDLETKISSLENSIKVLKEDHLKGNAGSVDVNLNIRSELIDILKEAVR